MNRKRKSAWQRMALVGMVGVVALIGDMRASGSQPLVSAVPGAVAPSPKASARAVNRRRTPGGVQTHDDTTAIPGIYAWDPDVRLVYYRHVGKWM